MGKSFLREKEFSLFIDVPTSDIIWKTMLTLHSRFLLISGKLFIPTQWEFAFIFDARKISNSKDLKGTVGFPRDS
jgi:hypothetical protein